MGLDLENTWTDADLATLTSSLVDNRDWRLEVSKDGVAEPASRAGTGRHVEFECHAARACKNLAMEE